MAIVIRCPFCKTDQSYKNKVCSNCGKEIPTRGRDYRVMLKRPGGGWVKKSAGASLEVAKNIESKIKTELIEGTYFDRRKRVPTLDEIWEKYLEWLKQNGKTWKSDLSRYTTHLMPRFGNRELNRITPFDIEKMIVEMRKGTNARNTNFSPQTVKHVVTLLRRLLNKAIKWGTYDGDNPIARITMPKVDNEVTEYLELEEISHLCDILDNYYDIQAANLTKFALFTGLRRGELFKLKWDDVDLKNGWLYIREPKGGKSEVIPLNALARKVLENHPKVEGSPYVFPGKDGMQRKEFKTAWKTIKKLAELPDNFRFHGLRHVYATLLASSGKVDLYTLQKLLTHKSPAMTQRYAHLVEESLRRGTCVMDEVIAQVKEGKIENKSN